MAVDLTYRRLRFGYTRGPTMRLVVDATNALAGDHDFEFYADGAPGGPPTGIVAGRLKFDGAISRATWRSEATERRLGDTAFPWTEAHASLLLAGDGSAGAPSFAFENDLDTGLYRPGDNVLRIATGGTARWEFTTAAILAVTDSALDIGAAAGASRPRDVYVGRGLNVGGTTAMATVGDGIFANGLVVGFDATPAADQIRLGDAAFMLAFASGVTPKLEFDTNDSIGFTRGTNVMGFVVNGATIMQVETGALRINGATGTVDLIAESDNDTECLLVDASADLVNCGAQVAFSGVITPAAIAAATNDYNPTGLAQAFAIRQDVSGGNQNITGLAGGVGGRMVMFVNINTGTNGIIFINESASSAAANRFSLPNSANLAVGALRRTVTFWYDTAASRWVVHARGHE